jgi:hypothetical protein
LVIKKYCIPSIYIKTIYTHSSLNQTIFEFFYSRYFTGAFFFFSTVDFSHLTLNQAHPNFAHAASASASQSQAASPRQPIPFLQERENPSAQSPRKNAPWVWGRGSGRRSARLVAYLPAGWRREG